MQPDSQWFDLGRLADESIRLAREEKECGGCVLEAEVPEKFYIFGDRQLLLIALVHLLKNGCFASPDPQSPVQVGVAGESGDKTMRREIVLEVRDRGTGLDPSVRHTLLDPFVTTREDTAGLGLAIVNQVAAAHNGSFTIVENPGGGCTARLTLPLPEEAIH